MIKPWLWPVLHPYRFWWFAIVISGYYGVRGIVIQKHHTENENRKLKVKKLKEWTQRERWFVHYIQDFIYNFVCSIAGFLALSLDIKFINSLTSLATIEAGTGILIAFLNSL